MRTDMRTTLSKVIRYLHLEAQLARSEEEFEDYSIALRLLGLLCDGWSSGPYLFNLACSYATGVPHAKYLRRRAERAEWKRFELLRAIPDYDYSREPRIPDRDPTDGRRHFGNKYGGDGSKGREIKEAAARLGMTESGIRARLYLGWTREQSLSEPQRQGRKLYGNQLCGVGDQEIPEDDADATRDTDANDARQQISDLECGQAPKIATLFQVARALQVSPACLIRIAESRRRVSDPLPRQSRTLAAVSEYSLGHPTSERRLVAGTGAREVTL